MLPRVVTLFHFYCGLRLRSSLRLGQQRPKGSNPFPFLLWIATAYFFVGNFYVIRSNPFPFLLWIATNLLKSGYQCLIAVVTLFHFYCGLRLDSLNRKCFKTFRSNPFPFLLWIATCLRINSHKVKFAVVTLFHFYCGLRPPVGEGVFDGLG